MNDLALTTTEAKPAELADYALSVQGTLKQAHLIQEVMRAVMKDGEHYGVIPGTSGKRSLFKSGAEKLSFVFGLSNRLDIKAVDLPGGHREYTITCDLFDRAGNQRGQGVGSASTMESKHRYRGAAGKACPKCSAMAIRPSKKEYGGGYYCDQKSGGCGFTCKGGSPEAKALDLVPTVRQENADPADQWNTVLKMAKKRALVDAVLTATAASDIFSQDIEDLESQLDTADSKDEKPAAPVPARTVVKDPAKPTQGIPVEIKASNDLWTDLEKKYGKGTGTPIVLRICKLHGADVPKNIAVERLPAFGRDIGVISEADTLERIEDILATWENAAKDSDKIQ